MVSQFSFNFHFLMSAVAEAFVCFRGACAGKHPCPWAVGDGAPLLSYTVLRGVLIVTVTKEKNLAISF